jgi:hypothetical protein
VEKKMDINMEELKISISTISLRTLYEIFSQAYIRTQGNNVNVEEINIEPQNHDYSSPSNLHHRGFHSTPRNYLIPKININKFDGKDPITWIFQMEKLFDLHQVLTLQKVVIASLYL